MVSHESRPVNLSRLMMAVKGQDVQLSVQDQYQEIRSRFLMTAEHFRAVKDNYDTIISSNSKNIEHLQKSVRGGHRDLKASRSNVLKPTDDTSLQHLRDQFVKWASQYTESSAESAVDLKFSHVNKLIGAFDDLLHSRQRKINKIKELNTIIQAETKNNTMDRVDRNLEQTSRILEITAIKMKEKYISAVEVHNKYKQMIEELKEELAVFPRRIQNLEDEIARRKKMCRVKILCCTSKARSFLSNKLIEQRTLERKFDIKSEVHRRVLIDAKRRSMRLKSQIYESKDIRRLTQGMFELDPALLNNGAAVEAEKQRRTLIKQKQQEWEDLTSCEARASFLNSFLSSADYDETFQFQKERSDMLKNKKDEVLKELNKKRKIYSGVKEKLMEVIKDFSDIHSYHVAKIKQAEKKIRAANQKSKETLAKKLSIKADTDVIMGEIGCICDRFVEWAEVQAAINSTHPNSENFFDLAQLSPCEKGMCVDEVIEHIEEFRQVWFKVVSDILNNIGRQYPVYNRSDELHQAKICAVVVKAARRWKISEKLIELRSKFSRVTTDVYRVKASVESVSGDSALGEDSAKNMKNFDPLQIHQHSVKGTYQTREQMKNYIEHFVQAQQGRRLRMRREAAWVH